MAMYLFTDANMKVIGRKRFLPSSKMTAQPDDLDYEEQHAKYTPVGKARAHQQKLEEERDDMIFLWLLVEGR